MSSFRYSLSSGVESTITFLKCCAAQCIAIFALSAPLAFAEEQVINLESTITGDKEQPAVSYFIPWKDIGTPDKLQWNMDNKHDDTLQMVDRDVMLRSMQVYQQMNIETPNQD